MTDERDNWTPPLSNRDPGDETEPDVPAMAAAFAAVTIDDSQDELPRARVLDDDFGSEQLSIDEELETFAEWVKRLPVSLSVDQDGERATGEARRPK